MKSLEAFLSRLNPLVPGCPEPVAFQALRDAAIAFCEDTHIVQIYTDPVRTTVGERQYDIDLPNQMELVRVLGAWHNSSPLQLVANQNAVYLHAPRNDPDGGSSNGAPRVAHVLEPRTIHIFPPPSAQDVGHLTLKVALKPTRGAKQLDDALFDDWAEAIVHGAAYRLAMTPGRSYTNTELAGLSLGVYTSALSRARLEARKGRVIADVTVRPRPFIRGSGF